MTTSDNAFLDPDTTGAPNEQTRKQYTRELLDQIHEGLVRAARLGWTPNDLRHLLSSKIDHLLFRALHRVAEPGAAGGGKAVITEPTRAAWQRQCHPVGEIPLSTGTLESIISQLRRIPPLRDQVLLGDTDAVEDRDSAFAALTPEQRKAHHRIIALLKKAEATNFEGEADVLVAKAQQLRQRYRIESVLLARETTDDVDHTELIAQRVYLRAPWIKHQFSLLAGVARTNSCASMLLTRDGIATVLGRDDDVRHVSDLFASLNRQRDHFMRTAAGAHQAADRGETSAYRRSFMVAYTAHITVLLDDAARHASNESLAHRRTLPVLAARGVRAQQKLSELFPRARSISLTSRHPAGYRDGVDAAHQSHLGGDAAGLGSMSA